MQITLIITIIMMIIIDLVVCINKLRKTEIRLLWPPFSSSLLPNHRHKDELQMLLRFKANIQTARLCSKLSICFQCGHPFVQIPTKSHIFSGMQTCCSRIQVTEHAL